MKASFVLVNYNRKKELLITVSKTKEIIGDKDYEIVIVDNASTDGSADAIKANHPDVVLIENKINTGAPAWNLGFEKAKGDYFIIIDDDSHIVSGLEQALNYLDSNADIGILALNVLTGPYTSKGWRWTDGDQLVGFIGCGAIFRKTVYDKIGGYADWIFLYVNEWDLGLRCIEAGYRVEYFAGCKVDHRASALHRTNKRLAVLGTKHEMGIVYKHFARDRWKYIGRIFINSMKGIRQLQMKQAWYHFLGTIAFLKARKAIGYTPVSESTQDMFLAHFERTKPAFAFLKRSITRLQPAHAEPKFK